MSCSMTLTKKKDKWPPSFCWLLALQTPPLTGCSYPPRCMPVEQEMLVRASLLTFPLFVLVKNQHQISVLMFLSSSLAELPLHFWIIPKPQRHNKHGLDSKSLRPKWHQVTEFTIVIKGPYCWVLQDYKFYKNESYALLSLSILSTFFVVFLNAWLEV